MSGSNMSNTVKMITEVKKLTDADIDEVTAIIHKYLTAIIAPANNDFEKLDWEALINYFAAICKLQNPLAFPVLASIMKDSRKHEDFGARALSELLDMDVDRVFGTNRSAALNQAALINGMSTGSFSRSGLNTTETDFKPHNAGKASGTPGLFAMFGSSVSGGAHVTPYYGQKSSWGYGGSHMSPYSGQIGGDHVSRGDIVDLQQAMRASILKTQALETELQSTKVALGETTKKTDVNSESIKRLSASSQANADTFQKMLDTKIQNQKDKAAAEKKRQEDKAENRATKDTTLAKQITDQAIQVYRAMEEEKARAALRAQQAASEEESGSDHEEEAAQAGGKRKGKTQAKARAPAKRKA